MTLLLIMVGFLAVAFNTASVAWRQGEHDVERTQSARSTVDVMARDLSQAIVSANIQFYGNSNNVAFVAPVNDDPNAADLAEVAYVLNWDDPTIPPFKLIRRFTTTNTNAWDVYSHPADWPSTAEFASTVCDTVMNFTLTYYDNNNPPNAYDSWNSSTNASTWTEGGVPIASTPATGAMTNAPPAYINIHLEVVDSRTATLLRTLPNPSVAYNNLTNQTVRKFDAYVKIPQR